MGDINVIELVLLAIVTFIFAIDQFSLTELIYRPMIACPIIGVILGDPATGLAIGGTYELMMVGNMPIGGAQPPNAVLGGIVAMVFAVKAHMDINTALGACMIFATFGQYVVTLVFTATSALMAKADKAAAEANPKGITACLNIHMGGLGLLFAVIAIVAYVGGTAAAPALESFATKFSWVMAGLGAAGAMMRFVGFSILMKIMMAADLWGWLLAGFALVQLFGGLEATASAALILVAFVGIAIALLDFRINSLAKNAEGGMSDGI